MIKDQNTSHGMPKPINGEAGALVGGGESVSIIIVAMEIHTQDADYLWLRRARSMSARIETPVGPFILTNIQFYPRNHVQSEPDPIVLTNGI